MQNLSKQITIALYHIDGQNENAQVLIKDSTIWASQKTIAELFGVSVPTINEHIKNILSEGELDKNSTIRKILIVQNEGTRQVSREIEHYSIPSLRDLPMASRGNLKRKEYNAKTRFCLYFIQQTKRHFVCGRNE